MTWLTSVTANVGFGTTSLKARPLGWQLSFLDFLAFPFQLSTNWSRAEPYLGCSTRFLTLSVQMLSETVGSLMWRYPRPTPCLQTFWRSWSVYRHQRPSIWDWDSLWGLMTDRGEHQRLWFTFLSDVSFLFFHKLPSTQPAGFCHLMLRSLCLKGVQVICPGRSIIITRTCSFYFPSSINDAAEAPGASQQQDRAPAEQSWTATFSSQPHYSLRSIDNRKGSRQIYGQ